MHNPIEAENTLKSFAKSLNKLYSSSFLTDLASLSELEIESIMKFEFTLCCEILNTKQKDLKPLKVDSKIKANNLKVKLIFPLEFQKLKEIIIPENIYIITNLKAFLYKQRELVYMSNVNTQIYRVTEAFYSKSISIIEDLIYPEAKFLRKFDQNSISNPKNIIFPCNNENNTKGLFILSELMEYHESTIPHLLGNIIQQKDLNDDSFDKFRASEKKLLITFALINSLDKVKVHILYSQEQAMTLKKLLIPNSLIMLRDVKRKLSANLKLKFQVSFNNQNIFLVNNSNCIEIRNIESSIEESYLISLLSKKLNRSVLKINSRLLAVLNADFYLSCEVCNFDVSNSSIYCAKCQSTGSNFNIQAKVKAIIKDGTYKAIARFVGDSALKYFSLGVEPKTVEITIIQEIIDYCKEFGPLSIDKSFFGSYKSPNVKISKMPFLYNTLYNRYHSHPVLCEAFHDAYRKEDSVMPRFMAEKENEVFINGCINTNTKDIIPCVKIIKVMDIDIVSRSYDLIYNMRDFL